MDRRRRTSTKLNRDDTFTTFLRRALRFRAYTLSSAGDKQTRRNCGGPGFRKSVIFARGYVAPGSDLHSRSRLKRREEIFERRVVVGHWKLGRHRRRRIFASAMLSTSRMMHFRTISRQYDALWFVNGRKPGDREDGKTDGGVCAGGREGEAGVSFPERFNHLFTWQRPSGTFHAIRGRHTYFKFAAVGVLIARNECTLRHV